MNDNFKPYKNYNSENRICCYHLIPGDTKITIAFDKAGATEQTDLEVYEFTHESAGSDNVRKIIALAEKGEGLNSFLKNNEQEGWRKPAIVVK